MRLHEQTKSVLGIFGGSAPAFQSSESGLPLEGASVESDIFGAPYLIRIRATPVVIGTPRLMRGCISNVQRVEGGTGDRRVPPTTISQPQATFADRLTVLARPSKGNCPVRGDNSSLQLAPEHIAW